MIKNRKQKSGFTLAETMVVVAIIAILAALSFIAVHHYMRVFKQLQYDNAAKEIFISAQNHLSMAYNEGYLGKADEYGETDYEGSNPSGIYYFVVDQDVSSYKDTILDLMLPFGSIEENVRSGGSYVVRYYKDTARVVDVFYSDASDSKYGHHFDKEEYGVLMTINTDSKEDKLARRNYGDDNSVLGYYGAEYSDVGYGDPIASPYLIVDNAERLMATVKLVNPLKKDEQLRLIIKGDTGEAYVTLKAKGTDSSNTKFCFSLDDITDHVDTSILNSGKHFSEMFTTVGTKGDLTVAKVFTVGEELKIYAEVSNNNLLTNIGKSVTAKANSIFGNNTEENIIDISNIRHLENLDANVSKHTVADTATVKYTAKQTADLDWNVFLNNIGNTSASIRYEDNLGNIKKTNSGCYYPVSLKFNYNGDRHAVSNVIINYGGSAGMFSDLKKNKTIESIELIDFIVKSSSGNAGALVGTLGDSSDSEIKCKVTNVLARETFKSNGSTGVNVKSKINATENAGGLIGACYNSTIEYSAASLTIESGSNSGGLIGLASGSATIDGCYSAGHTYNGKYYQTVNNKRVDIINVTGTKTAGGLVGLAILNSDTPIKNSYSTCSVNGNSAGGFIGHYSGKEIKNSYATGYVAVSKDDENGNKGAFIGHDQVLTFSTYTDCYYLIAPNDVLLGAIGNEENNTEISAIDKDKASYTTYISLKSKADPYDDTLATSFKGMYLYKTVSELSGNTKKHFVNEHYGDWADYQTLVIN